MPDGSVEIIAQGSEDHLRCLLPFVHSGPRLAEIDAVEVLWRTTTQSFSGFRTR
jgi:acylphosphatase